MTEGELLSSELENLSFSGKILCANCNSNEQWNTVYWKTVKILYFILIHSTWATSDSPLPN